MRASASAAAFVDLCMAFISLEILSFLDPQLGADPPSAAQAALLLDDSAVEQLLLPLAALAALLTAAAVIYYHDLHHIPAVAGAGAGNDRRLWRGPFAALCISAATLLHLFFFVQQQPRTTAGVAVGGDVGAQARALGLAAARVLPAAATATFFLGMALMIVAHIRAGGEGGGGAFDAVDGHTTQGAGAVSFLTKTALAAAAALVFLTALALYGLCGDAGIY